MRASMSGAWGGVLHNAGELSSAASSRCGAAPRIAMCFQMGRGVAESPVAFFPHSASLGEKKVSPPQKRVRRNGYAENQNAAVEGKKRKRGEKRKGFRELSAEEMTPGVSSRPQCLYKQ